MNDIGPPDVLGNFDCRSGELTVTLSVVGVIAAGAAVEVGAIKVGGIVHEEIAHAVDHGAIGGGRKTEARTAHGNCDAGQYNGVRLRSAIAWQHHRDFVSEAD